MSFKLVLVDEADLAAVQQAAPKAHPVSKGDLGDNSLLIVRLDGVPPAQARDYGMAVQQYIRDELDKISPEKRIPFFITYGQNGIEVADEADMAKAGWVRKR